MKNLKISKKIICTFAVVLLLTFVLGVVSLVSTNNIASTSDNYVNIYLFPHCQILKTPDVTSEYSRVIF